MCSSHVQGERHCLRAGMERQVFLLSATITHSMHETVLHAHLAVVGTRSPGK